MQSLKMDMEGQLQRKDEQILSLWKVRLNMIFSFLVVGSL